MIQITSDRLAATINPLGAELHTLQDAGGRDLLWDGDPAFWTGRAPLLFPIVGGLNQDRYRWGGQTYSLPKHGFARRSAFDLVRSDAGEAVLRLEATDDTRPAYPFDFRLDVTFRLAGPELAMTAEVSNLGQGDMPASFGFHPALLWPLPFGAARGEHRLRFDEDEPAPIRRLDGAGLLDPEARPTPVQGRDLALADSLFEDDAIIFDHPASDGLLYGAPAGPSLRIAWQGCPQLGVWTKPGAGFICVEPWRGMADPQAFDDDIRAKPGVFVLGPGEARRMSMAITLQA